MDEKLKRKFKRMELVSGDLKLTNTQSIGEYSRDVQEILHHCYSSAEPSLRRQATLFASLYYHGKQLFIITRDLMGTLTKNDVNTSLKSIDAESYNKMMARLINEDFIECLRGPKKGKAGLYKLVDSSMVNVLETAVGREYLDAQIENGISWYDSDSKKNKKKQRDPLVEAAQRRINERTDKIPWS